MAQEAIAEVVDADQLAHHQDLFAADRLPLGRGRIGFVEQVHQLRHRVAQLQGHQRLGGVLGRGGPRVTQAVQEHA